MIHHTPHRKDTIHSTKTRSGFSSTMNNFLAVLILSPFCVEATSYTYFKLANDGTISCGGTFLESTTISLGCTNAICPLGTEASVIGDVIVGSNDLPSSTASVKMSISSYNIGSYDDLDLCSYMTSYDGSSCPTASTYALTDVSVPVPSASTAMRIAGSLGIAATVTVDFTFDTGDTEQCSVKVALVNKSEGYSMAYSVVAFAIVGVGTALGIKRTRKVGTIHLDETEGSHTHFEMMPNEQIVQV